MVQRQRWMSVKATHVLVSVITPFFWATVALLAYVGIRRAKWKHDDLRQVFGLECVRRFKICPPEFGEWLGDLYHLRSEAVYKLEQVTDKKAERALRKAEIFVKHALEVCQQ